jgi:hypothetical protein
VRGGVSEQDGRFAHRIASPTDAITATISFGPRKRGKKVANGVLFLSLQAWVAVMIC